jgi:hypothetical protein
LKGGGVTRVHHLRAGWYSSDEDEVAETTTDSGVGGIDLSSSKNNG